MALLPVIYSLLWYVYELYCKINALLLHLYRWNTDTCWSEIGNAVRFLGTAQKLFYAFHWFKFRSVLFDWSHYFPSSNQRFCLQPHTKVIVRQNMKWRNWLAKQVKPWVQRRGEGATLWNLQFKENEFYRHITELRIFSDDVVFGCQCAEVIAVFTKGW